jgi:hypothetical protein
MTSLGMSAFGTKKPGGDEAVQLTFPGVFSRAYKQLKLGERYAPSNIPAARQDYVGSDFQALEHQRRRADAHHMVMAAVHATREARRRAFSSHAGYYGLPEPVLTQRVRGSNFGVGGGGGMGYPSPFAGAVGAGLEGGVIASREGRVYIKDFYARRKAELDAIDASQLEGPSIQAQVEAKMPNDFSELAKIELMSYLDQLQTQLVSPASALGSPETFRRFLALLVRFVVVADPRELEQITVKLIDVLDDLESRAEQDEDGGQNPGVSVALREGYFDLIYDYLQKVLQYVKGMYRGLSMSVQDRKTLSKSLLKEIKIGQVADGMVKWAQQFGKVPFFTGPRFRPHGGDDDMPGDDDEGGDEGEFGSVAGTAGTFVSSSGRSRGTGEYSGEMFSRQPMSAELTGGPRVQLSRDQLRMPDVRDFFGRQGQPGELRAMRRYAGEQEGPGAQDEADFEGDVAEAAAAEYNPGGGLGSSAFPGMLAQRLQREAESRGLERLRRERDAGMEGAYSGEFAEEGAAETGGVPAVAEADSAEAYFDKLPASALEEGFPPIFQEIYDGIMRSGTPAAYVDSFTGAASVPKLRRIIQAAQLAFGKKDTQLTKSTQQKNLRNMLRLMLGTYSTAARAAGMPKSLKSMSEEE